MLPPVVNENPDPAIIRKTRPVQPPVRVATLVDPFIIIVSFQGIATELAAVKVGMSIEAPGVLVPV